MNMVQSRSRDPHGATMYPLREDWLALHDEEVPEPGLPIIDPHHHLWDRQGSRYLFEELLDDTGSGHDIRSTVFIQCRSMYRAAGPVALQPVGETEFVNGIAAQSASGNYGRMRACAGIIGHADLTRGAGIRDVLEAHITAGGGRFKGIRFSTALDGDITITPVPPMKDIMMTPAWRQGFAQLAPLGLTFDALVFHSQLDQLTDLARAFPETRIILDHVGCPLGIGRYAGRRDEVFAGWRTAITELGRCRNAYVKLGGLGMTMFGFDFEGRPKPPSSAELAELWKPYIETCIDAFTPQRAMFESNFPVDKIAGAYKTYWNAFKRLARDYSAADKAALFHGAAARAYDLPDV